MKNQTRKLLDILSLLTIVVSLSSVGSMYVYYMGTFETFLIPKIIHQIIIFIIGVASFIYLGCALRLYHHKD